MGFVEREGRMSVNKTVVLVGSVVFRPSHRMKSTRSQQGLLRMQGNTDESNKPQHTEYSRRDVAHVSMPAHKNVMSLTQCS